MKTVTLTEEAYQRIAALKQSHKDSFSKVILRSVPKTGTAAQLLDAVRQLPPLSEKQAKIMRSVVRDLNDPSRWRDPWTTFRVC